MTAARYALAAAFATTAAALIAGSALAEASSLLRDQRGTPFTLHSLRGTPVVLTFIATHCQDACPLINAQFAQMQRELRAARLPVRLLTITLDPEHDRLSDMQRLARIFGADPNYWLLASGRSPAIHRIMRRFGVVAQRGAGGYADVHATFIYLLDKRGTLVKTILASSNLTADLYTKLQHDWRKLN